VRHALEQYADNRLIRPRADYIGSAPRPLAAGQRRKTETSWRRREVVGAAVVAAEVRAYSRYGATSRRAMRVVGDDDGAGTSFGSSWRR